MLVRITDWQKYLGDGEKYLACARGAATKRREIFTPTIIYNVTAMAIEKYLMGLLMYHGTLAENHTMRDLLDAVERVTGPQPQFVEDFHYLDAFQDICSLEAYQRREPSWEDIPRILACGAQVRDFVSQAGKSLNAWIAENLDKKTTADAH